MRKSSSMGNLASCAVVPLVIDHGAGDQGYHSDGGILQSATGRRRRCQERKRGSSKWSLLIFSPPVVLKVKPLFIFELSMSDSELLCTWCNHTLNLLKDGTSIPYSCDFSMMEVLVIKLDDDLFMYILLYCRSICDSLQVGTFFISCLW